MVKMNHRSKPGSDQVEQINLTSGDLIAAFNLGLCFAKGIGVQQNEPFAANG
jgi:hypothetical protein